MKAAARRHGVTLAFVLLAGPAAAAQRQPEASADNYPKKPIRFLVPFVGGVADIYARVIGQRLQEAWNQPVIIDNRPAAGGLQAAEVTAKAAPDGYTLFAGIDGLVTINPALYRSLPYDPAKDFTPVTQIFIAPLVIVVQPSLPVKSLKDLIDLAKQKPGQLNYGSPAIGNAGHLAAESFKIATGIDMVHIPYKGGAGALNALLGGEVALVFSNAGLAVPYVKAGRLKALAVSTNQRISVIADVPTVAEAGVADYEAATWTGVFTRSGTPKPIFTKLEREIVSILRRPDVQEGMTRQGLIPVASTSQEFAAVLKKETARYAKLISTLGIRAE